MARNWYGQKRIIKEDRYTRRTNQHSEWDITKEKLNYRGIILNKTLDEANRLKYCYRIYFHYIR